MPLSKEQLFNRPKSHLHTAAEVGEILDNYSTDELYAFVRDHLDMDIALRSYLEHQISSFVIAEESEQSYTSSPTL